MTLREVLEILQSGVLELLMVALHQKSWLDAHIAAVLGSIFIYVALIAILGPRLIELLILLIRSVVLPFRYPVDKKYRSEVNRQFREDPFFWTILASVCVSWALLMFWIVSEANG